MNNKIKIYVGCAILHASDEFKESVYKLKDSLREDYEILDFLGEGTDPHDVYHNDIKKCVASCDLLLGICDYASLGLGYELASAVEAYNKPVLAVAHRNANVSHLIQGIDSPLFSFERYNNLFETEQLIKNKIKANDL